MVENRLMRSWLVLLLVGLGACDVAGPGFTDAPAEKRSFQGSDFVIRHQGSFVKAVRVSPEFLPQFDSVAGKAALLAQIETGCVAKWVIGDPSVVHIGMSCSGKPAPPKPRRRRSLYCDIEDLYARGDSFAGHMECR